MAMRHLNMSSMVTVISSLVALVLATWALAAAATPSAQSTHSAMSVASLPIVELRQYTLRTGKRDVLIDLFEREFIEPQETRGIVVLGQFRDLDRPERFVWLRGFSDMPARARSLQEFYDGPIWQKHREVANATMIDSSNVLMLKPARAASGFVVDARNRPALGATVSPSTLVVATIYPFATPVDATFIELWERAVRPALERATGGRAPAYFVTDPSPNNFPRLPVREGEHVFVSFASFPSDSAYQALLAGDEWRRLSQEVDGRLSGAPEVLRLRPTSQSLIGK